MILRELSGEADVALVSAWMQEPHVVPWWGLDGPVARTREHIAAHPHQRSWLAYDGDSPVGYGETYRVADDPLAACYRAACGDHGFHLLIGPPQRLGAGTGRALARALIAQLLGSGATRAVCEPDVRNERMLALCRGLGGEELATLDLGHKRALLFAWEAAP